MRLVRSLPREHDWQHVAVGKPAGIENPCMHHDQRCPHFATLSAGLVKDKFGDCSPTQRSPSLRMTAGRQAQMPEVSLSQALKRSSSLQSNKVR